MPKVLFVSRPQEHLPYIDDLRGVAMLMVFLAHSLGAAYYSTFHFDNLQWDGLVRDFHAPAFFLCLMPITFGPNAVAMFFVISGFCIHLNHLRSRETGFNFFFTRRFFRIYPPYILALLFFSFLFAGTRLRFGHELALHQSLWPDIGQFVTHLLLIHNLFLPYCHGINAALWSLGTEAQIYLVYPLLIWYAVRFGWRRTLWLTAIIEIGLRTLEGVLSIFYPGFVLPRGLTSSPLIYGFCWSMGAVIAEAQFQGKPIPFQKVVPWIVVLLLIGCHFVRPLQPFEFMFASLLTAGLIARALHVPEPEPATQGWRRWIEHPFRTTGTISYSIFLIHQPIVNSVPRWALHFNHGQPLISPALFGLCLLTWPFIFFVSSYYYRWVELPSIALGKRLIKRKKAALAAAPAQSIPLSPPVPSA